MIKKFIKTLALGAFAIGGGITTLASTSCGSSAPSPSPDPDPEPNPRFQIKYHDEEPHRAVGIATVDTYKSGIGLTSQYCFTIESIDTDKVFTTDNIQVNLHNDDETWSATECMCNLKFVYDSQAHNSNGIYSWKLQFDLTSFKEKGSRGAFSIDIEDTETHTIHSNTLHLWLDFANDPDPISPDEGFNIRFDSTFPDGMPTVTPGSSSTQVYNFLKCEGVPYSISPQWECKVDQWGIVSAYPESKCLTAQLTYTGSGLILYLHCSGSSGDSTFACPDSVRYVIIRAKYTDNESTTHYSNELILPFHLLGYGTQPPVCDFNISYHDGYPWKNYAKDFIDRTWDGTISTEGAEGKTLSWSWWNQTEPYDVVQFGMTQSNTKFQITNHTGGTSVTWLTGTHYVLLHASYTEDNGISHYSNEIPFRYDIEY